jgi:hypothetical protein
VGCGLTFATTISKVATETCFAHIDRRWNWSLLNCYLSGRHEYAVGCEPGAIFLHCLHCGRRSPGWSLDVKAHGTPTLTTAAPVVPQASPTPARSLA